ncbi:DUF1127 domain-containing protein [Vannielia litorea]|uniref:YjiS-like domain-containing protein n=1 Tax=Vannielia litorea TaxID=1217970 RepID=A0A1N6G2C4_9RHOB|nr:DUF1127 domain-containing protein [Vannielia litorea]SIO01650.1 protein of unknown function [Vannielia litorea]
MAYATAQNTAHTGIIGRIEAFIEARREAAAKRRVYRQTLRELQTLTSRDLADLGIAPSMIRSVAYQAAYGA